MCPSPWRVKHRERPEGEPSPLSSLRAEIDRLFDSCVREPLSAWEWPFGGQASFHPAVDLAQTEDEVVVRAELAGVDPADLEVSVSRNELLLAGEKKPPAGKDKEDFYQIESRFGTFRRSVKLPEGVDPEKVTAEHANGVLTIRLGKSPAGAPRRIEVKVDRGGSSG